MPVDPAQLLKDREAACLALDEDAVHLKLGADVGGVLKELMKRGALVVGVDQHHLGCLLVAVRPLDGHHAVCPDRLGDLSGEVGRKNSPHGQGAEVAFVLLLAIGGIQSRHDVVEGGVGVVLVLIDLPPIALDDAATTRDRLLLVLTSGGVDAHDSLVTVHDGLGEAIWEQKLALHLSRIDVAQLGRELLAPCHEAHGQADVVVPKLPIEDQARSVALMQALHDDDDGRRDRVIEARRHGFKEPVLSRLADLLRGGVFDAQGIVDDHPIPTSTRDRTGCHGLPEARGGGLEFGLCVLIADHLNVRPQVLIPITLDQAAHADVVADG